MLWQRTSVTALPSSPPWQRTWVWLWTMLVTPAKSSRKDSASFESSWRPSHMVLLPWRERCHTRVPRLWHCWKHSTNSPMLGSGPCREWDDREQCQSCSGRDQDSGWKAWTVSSGRFWGSQPTPQGACPCDGDTERDPYGHTWDAWEGGDGWILSTEPTCQSSWHGWADRDSCRARGGVTWRHSTIYENVCRACQWTSIACGTCQWTPNACSTCQWTSNACGSRCGAAPAANVTGFFVHGLLPRTSRWTASRCPDGYFNSQSENWDSHEGPRQWRFTNAFTHSLSWRPGFSHYGPVGPEWTRMLRDGKQQYRRIY